MSDNKKILINELEDKWLFFTKEGIFDKDTNIRTISHELYSRGPRVNVYRIITEINNEYYSWYYNEYPQGNNITVDGPLVNYQEDSITQVIPKEETITFIDWIPFTASSTEYNLPDSLEGLTTNEINTEINDSHDEKIIEENYDEEVHIEDYTDEVKENVEDLGEIIDETEENELEVEEIPGRNKESINTDQSESDEIYSKVDEILSNVDDDYTIESEYGFETTDNIEAEQNSLS